jgi:hypothetical protein
MACDREETRTAAGPYRLRPPRDPGAGAILAEALSTARRELGERTRARRRFTLLAVAGYLGAAVVVGSPGEREAGVGRGVAWTSVAVGATCALIHAGRAGVRAHDLEAEIAGLEQLSAMLARSPRG